MGGVSFKVAAHVRDAGPDLLLFLHGLGCSKSSFHHVWQRRDLDPYSVLALDFVGFGESERPSGFTYSMLDQARACTEILKGFPGKRLHIVAHSMGGAVALLLPDELLKRTTSFINVEGNLIGEDCSIASRNIISVSSTAFESDLLPDMRVNLNRLGKGYTDIDSASAEALYRSAQSLVHCSDSRQLLDIFQFLSCNKAYFYGAKNARHPTVSEVDGICKVEIQQSGHFVMNDNPNGFYDELSAFINAPKATLS